MISVGIDVSKGLSTIFIIKPYGEVLVPPRDVQHTATELQSLIFLIKSLGDETRAVMEYTGNYHLPVLQALPKAEIFDCVENPLVMKKYASATLRKGKTDKLDSIKLANYGIEKWFSLRRYESTEQIYAELRVLGRQYAGYIEMRVNALNRFLILLEQTEPGISTMLQSHCVDKSKCKLCDFVSTFWHFDVITKKSEYSFV